MYNAHFWFLIDTLVSKLCCGVCKKEFDHLSKLESHRQRRRHHSGSSNAKVKKDSKQMDEVPKENTKSHAAEKEKESEVKTCVYKRKEARRAKDRPSTEDRSDAKKIKTAEKEQRPLVDNLGRKEVVDEVVDGDEHEKVGATIVISEPAKVGGKSGSSPPSRRPSYTPVPLDDYASNHFEVPNDELMATNPVEPLIKKNKAPAISNEKQTSQRNLMKDLFGTEEENSGHKAKKKQDADVEAPPPVKDIAAILKGPSKVRISTLNTVKDDLEAKRKRMMQSLKKSDPLPEKETISKADRKRLQRAKERKRKREKRRYVIVL